MIARWLGLCLGTVGLVTIVGCFADDGLEQRYPVSGKVSYKGKPLEKGLITFTPENPEGRGASGNIKEGAYTLTTNTPDDGAFPGKYSVTVSDLNVDPNAAFAETEKAAAKSGLKAMPGMVDPAMFAKIAKKAKNNVPLKYTKPATSGLKADVQQKSNTINYDLAD